MSVLILTVVRVYCTLCLGKGVVWVLDMEVMVQDIGQMGIVSRCEDDNMMFQIEIFA